MLQKVPVDEIKWVDGETVESWTADDLMAMNPNASHSYILEVDLEIPESIHDSTSDYPLCPEKLKINEDMISPKFRSVYTYIQKTHTHKHTNTHTHTHTHISILIKSESLSVCV